MHPSSATPFRGLRGLPLSWRVLLTGFVLILGSGYLMGALNAALAVGLSPAAIADHYGDKSLSPEERAAIASQGYVEEEFSLDDEEGGDGEEGSAGAAMEAGPGAALAGGAMAAHDASGGHSAGQAMAHGAMGDDTLPAQILVQVSHIHLLGFALILISAGGLACLTGLSEPVKTTLVGLLFFGLFGDIAGLNLVRFVSGGFAWLTFLAAITVGLCLAFISLRVLWELWGPAPRPAAREEGAGLAPAR